MKSKAARRLATTISRVLAAVVLAGGVIEGCAAGSDVSPGGPVDNDSGFTADASSDVTGDSTSNHDASGGHDATQGDDAADAGHPSDAADDVNDGNATDASNRGDAADAADSSDSGPLTIFGPTCPTGTVYTEPFTSDPIPDGTFTSLIGLSTYSAIARTLSLTTGSPNTQLWIGPRPQWTNYTVAVPVRIDSSSSGGNGGITFRMEATPTSPANNAGQMYFAGIGSGQVVLGIENGNWTEFTGASGTFAVATFYTLQVTVSGSAITVAVNGTPYATNYVDTTYAFGSIGLRTFSSAMTYGAITVTCN